MHVYRFTHPVSQVGAGIVIACYMQGICACKCGATKSLYSFFFLIYSFISGKIDGYDPLVNDDR